MDKILICGGTGFLGSNLINELKNKGYYIVLLTRGGNSFNKVQKVADEVLVWDHKTKSKELQELIERVDSIVNLAGRNIFQSRWSKKHIAEIHSSRIIPTQILTEAATEANNKPKVFLNASATGYYGIDFEEEKNEDSLPGEDFLAKLCIEWEDALKPLQKVGIRTVPIRFGIITDKNGGALQRILITEFFRIIFLPGTGKQKVSYIKLENAIRLIIEVLENSKINCSINAVEKNAESFKDLVRMHLHSHKYLFIPIPEFILKIIIGSGYKYLTRTANVISKFYY